MKFIKEGAIKLRKSSGFTLVELLVVIAVLGILAAVVLVAINPLEQMARGRDSGRKTAVGQIANALQAYYTSHANVTGQGYPEIAGVAGHSTPNWLEELEWAQEIKNVPATLDYQVGGAVACTAGSAVNAMVNNYCYNTDVTGEAIVYARMESSAENSKCTTSGDVAYFMYSTAAGRGGIVCSAPANDLPFAITAPTFVD